MSPVFRVALLILLSKRLKMTNTLEHLELAIKLEELKNNRDLRNYEVKDLEEVK